MKLFRMIVCAALAGPVWVQAAPDYAVAQKMVEETANTFIAKIKEKKKEIEKKPAIAHDLAEEVVLPHFDFERMSKLVLARKWNDANDVQKQRFTREFKRLLLRTYAHSIVEYSDQKVEFLPYRPGSKENLVVIPTEVKQSVGRDIPIDYTLFFGDVWKVVDVKIEDVSLVINYRNTFSSDIERLGMDKFLDDLESRNKEALGG